MKLSKSLSSSHPQKPPKNIFFFLCKDKKNNKYQSYICIHRKDTESVQNRREEKENDGDDGDDDGDYYKYAKKKNNKKIKRMIFKKQIKTC